MDDNDNPTIVAVRFAGVLPSPTRTFTRADLHRPGSSDAFDRMRAAKELIDTGREGPTCESHEDAYFTDTWCQPGRLVAIDVDGGIWEYLGLDLAMGTVKSPIGTEDGTAWCPSGERIEVPVFATGDRIASGDDLGGDAWRWALRDKGIKVRRVVCTLTSEEDS